MFGEIIEDSNANLCPTITENVLSQRATEFIQDILGDEDDGDGTKELKPIGSCNILTTSSLFSSYPAPYGSTGKEIGQSILPEMKEAPEIDRDTRRS